MKFTFIYDTKIMTKLKNLAVAGRESSFEGALSLLVAYSQIKGSKFSTQTLLFKKMTYHAKKKWNQETIDSYADSFVLGDRIVNQWALFEQNKLLHLASVLQRMQMDARKIKNSLQRQGFAEFFDTFEVACKLNEMSSLTQQKNNQKALLPPNVSGKPTLILDMDEHLIHSCEMNGFHKNMTTGTIITINRAVGQNLRLNMRERPYLRTFLSVISEHFELVLFTAGEESYARKVIEIIDPDNYISHHLFRKHCTAYNSFIYVKDLKRLGRDMTRLAIMDNSSIAYATDLDNAVPMYPWRGDEPRDLFDVELIEVIPLLLKMKKEPNFQTFLKKTFQLSKMKRLLNNRGPRNL